MESSQYHNTKDDNYKNIATFSKSKKWRLDFGTGSNNINTSVMESYLF